MKQLPSFPVMAVLAVAGVSALAHQPPQPPQPPQDSVFTSQTTNVIVPALVRTASVLTLKLPDSRGAGGDGADQLLGPADGRAGAVNAQNKTAMSNGLMDLSRKSAHFSGCPFGSVVTIGGRGGSIRSDNIPDRRKVLIENLAGRRFPWASGSGLWRRALERNPLP